MSRILLVHWHEAEARERARTLRSLGHTVIVHAQAADMESFRRVKDHPPDLVVIDLARLPSHGRAVGAWLRQTKATRRVPLVFMAGDPEKTAIARRLLPDAQYASWRSIRGAISPALAAAPAAPVVPGTMAEYVGAPLTQKLGLKAGATLILANAPKGIEDLLGAIPEGATLRRRLRPPAPLVLLFARSRAELERRFPAAASATSAGGSLWIAWPKQSSGAGSDLTQAVVRALGLACGWVDYKIASIDGTWSGLRFARRE